MSLFESLKTAVKEEDVKDRYVDALGLKRIGYNKGWVDIQTDKIWFEAKQGSSTPTFDMFTELFRYVYEAMKRGESLPIYLCCFDARKAALIPTNKITSVLEKDGHNIPWGKSASDINTAAVEYFSKIITVNHINYIIEYQEKQFISAVKSIYENGKIPRIEITPNNLSQVFFDWCNNVGSKLQRTERVTENGKTKHVARSPSNDERYLLFFADVMCSDKGKVIYEDLPAQIVYDKKKPEFRLRLLSGGEYSYSLVGDGHGYKEFWAKYSRPPKEKYRKQLLARRDTLIPPDTRAFQGEFYTPLEVVEKAYETLDALLGEDWQETYTVWDPCCGVGNLEVLHNHIERVYMSTLKQEDIDIMLSNRTALRAAGKFQYDYLNDDICADGPRGIMTPEDELTFFDYTMRGASGLPDGLKNAIAQNKEGKSKILILMNPPYAEAGNADNASKPKGKAKTKDGVANSTKVANVIMKDNWGKATNELFTQFLARIAIEMPGAVVAMFSTLKYVNSTNFEKFRTMWRAHYLGGFVVHSKAFDGLKGDFPIGFLVWKTANNDKSCECLQKSLKSIECTVYESVFDKDKRLTLEKAESKNFYNISADKFLSSWIDRPKANNQKEVIGLKNAVEPNGIGLWCDDAIGHLVCDSNDLQQAGQGTCLLSSASKIGHKGACYVTPDNLLQCAVVFTVRRIIAHTWLNDRDQFYQPNQELPTEFYRDCLIWMLFNGSNLTAGADNLVWNGKRYSITNHFVPYTESELGIPYSIDSNFMSKLLASFKKDKAGGGLSREAQDVLQEGKALWKTYFKDVDTPDVHERLKLGRADVGYYQIRQALKERFKETGDVTCNTFKKLDAAYKVLTDKLQPKVYEYGFLKK